MSGGKQFAAEVCDYRDLTNFTIPRSGLDGPSGESFSIKTNQGSTTHTQVLSSPGPKLLRKKESGSSLILNYNT